MDKWDNMLLGVLFAVIMLGMCETSAKRRAMDQLEKAEIRIKALEEVLFQRCAPVEGCVCEAEQP